MQKQTKKSQKLALKDMEEILKDKSVPRAVTSNTMVTQDLEKKLYDVWGAENITEIKEKVYSNELSPLIKETDSKKSKPKIKQEIIVWPKEYSKWESSILICLLVIMPLLVKYLPDALYTQSSPKVPTELRESVKEYEEQKSYALVEGFLESIKDGSMENINPDVVSPLYLFVLEEKENVEVILKKIAKAEIAQIKTFALNSAYVQLENKNESEVFYIEIKNGKIDGIYGETIDNSKKAKEKLNGIKASMKLK